MTAEPLTLDNFLRMGRYSFIFVFLAEFTILVQTGNQIFMSFAGSTPKITGCSNMNRTFSKDFDFCPMVQSGECTPVYHNPFYSIGEQWDLVCHKKHLVKDSTSYQMIGSLIGCLLFGQLSDNFGRRWPNAACLFMTCIFGVATVFSPNFTVFTILRIITTFFNAGQTVIVLTYMCEVFPKKHRMWLNFVLSWSPNILLVTGIGYVCKSWKTFSIVINLLALVPIALTFFIHESPYFLTRKSRMTDAKRVILAIGKTDGVSIDEPALDMVLQRMSEASNGQQTKKYTVLHLFYSWKLCAYTISLGFSFFCINLINYAVLFNMDELSGSLFINLLILGSIRFTINIVSAIIDFKYMWLGRKINHAACSGYALAALGVVFAAKLFDLPSSWDLAVRLLFVSAGSVVCQLYMINGVTTSEIYPSPIRNSAYAFNLLIANIGSVLAPQVFGLKSVFSSLPYAVMFAVLAGELLLCMVFIPESKGKPLVDSMPSPRERVFSRKRVQEDEEYQAEKEYKAEKRATASEELRKISFIEF